MTIHLPDELERDLRAKVHSGQFASIDDALAEASRLLLRRLEQEPPREDADIDAPGASTAPAARRPIWERADELRRSVPAEEWPRLPTDGAAQLDHYIYGSPKRPAS